jgi:methylenetetrahydrofolate dehydrogenase (NADP+)/methenyltetrahydrofolate cyclohydrolase
MTARIIDGKALSKTLREGYKSRVSALLAQGVQPGLAVILVGDNPASKVYVGNKVKACEEVGLLPPPRLAGGHARSGGARHHCAPQ